MSVILSRFYTDAYYYIIIFVDGNKLRLLGKYQVKIIVNAAELFYSFNNVIDR